MPIFEYQCKICEYEFEKLVRGETNHLSCPSCGSEEVEKQFSLFAAGSSSSDPAGGSGSRSCGTCRATSCGDCR